MTKIAERLTDALTARAAAVREESLRPLVAGATRPASARRQRKLVPLSAALGLAAAVIVVVEAGHLVHPGPSAPFADVASAHAPPPYYVDLDVNHILTVRATDSGRLTDQLPAPGSWGGAAMRLETALAASANGRTFVVVYNDRGTGVGPYRTAIYMFTLTSAGHIADFKQVRNGVLPGLARVSAAVSPDGSRVAIAGVPEAAAEGNGQPIQSARIIVVALRTGRRVVFPSGASRRGRQFAINDLSWTSNGRSLAYLMQWCGQLDPQFNAICDSGRPEGELRVISATGDPAPLTGGRLVLRGSRPIPSILQALMSPDGRFVVAMTERGRELSFARFDARTGALIAVLYRRQAVLEGPGAGRGPGETFLSSDGTGQYLIFDEDTGTVDGWIHDGRFHPMKIGPVGLWAASPSW